MMSSARKRCPRVFATATHMTWSERRVWALFCTSSGALVGTSMVALAVRSSMVIIVCCLASFFSVTMPIILSFVLGCDFRASSMGVAALTSMRCLRIFSKRLNLSWKYCWYSSMVPLLLSLPVGSSTMLICGSTSFAYG